jgi:CheY-like chemotaxis protein
VAPAAVADDAASAIVLLVEDEPISSRLCVKLLSPWVIPTRVAASVSAALKIIDGGVPVALACVDLGLPDGSGMHVVRALRARSPSVPILVVTGSEIPIDMREIPVLRKPFTIAQFREAIDDVVRSMWKTA